MSKGNEKVVRDMYVSKVGYKKRVGQKKTVVAWLRKLFSNLRSVPGTVPSRFFNKNLGIVVWSIRTSQE